VSEVGRMTKGKKKPIEQYEHLDKTRKNNPPVGMVTTETDRDGDKMTYAYDPHLDPQLVWAGKAEHTSFEVPTVSLHVHERIDPHTIIEAVERRNGEVKMEQPALFETPEENPPLRQAIDFYQHEHSWSNRLIAGDYERLCATSEAFIYVAMTRLMVRRLARAKPFSDTISRQFGE
jgi:adenine-specific DNA-methyltransferase